METTTNYSYTKQYHNKMTFKSANGCLGRTYNSMSLSIPPPPPSMVHRSGNVLIVRSASDALYADTNHQLSSPSSSSSSTPSSPQTTAAATTTTTTTTRRKSPPRQPPPPPIPPKDLPECKVKRNYTCATCEFFTQNPRHYLYHLRDVHDEKIRVYECPNCLYASRHYQKLLRHTRMVHNSTTTSGNTAINTSSTSAATGNRSNTGKVVRNSAKSVVQKADDDDIHKNIDSDCDNNNNNYNNNDHLQGDFSEDLDQEHEDNDVALQEDDYEYEEGDGSVKYGSGGGGGVKKVQMFKCSLCTYQSRTRAELVRHERDTHIKTKFFRCTKCTYVTHMKARFTKHVKYHSMPMIKCELCDFRTPYKWNLDRHCKNHNGRGAFKCSACNFTADIKQSLTVHEMNHHVPPVGQAAGLGVGRRRNKVGASDTMCSEDKLGDEDGGSVHQLSSKSAFNHHDNIKQIPQLSVDSDGGGDEDLLDLNHYYNNNTTKNNNNNNNVRNNCKKLQQPSPERGSYGPDFYHPDDIVQHANGNVYIKNKCKLCSFKSAWSGEMSKHEKRVHGIIRDSDGGGMICTTTTTTNSNNIESSGGTGCGELNPQNGLSGNGSKSRKHPRPIPNLIPLSEEGLKNAAKRARKESLPPLTQSLQPQTPVMSEQAIEDILAKSSNSALKDLASLFGSEDVFTKQQKKIEEEEMKLEVTVPGPNNSNNNNNEESFKQKNASFFDRLKERLMSGGATAANLTCANCGVTSTCLTEQAKHQKMCQKAVEETLDEQNSRTSSTHYQPSTLPITGGSVTIPKTTQTSSTRCQFCRQRCKSSVDLYNHQKTCVDALKGFGMVVDNLEGMSGIKIGVGYEDGEDDRHFSGMEEDEDEDDLVANGEETVDDGNENEELYENSEPHPMENRVFVWNNIKKAAPLPLQPSHSLPPPIQQQLPTMVPMAVPFAQTNGYETPTKNFQNKEKNESLDLSVYLSGNSPNLANTTATTTPDESDNSLMQDYLNHHQTTPTVAHSSSRQNTSIIGGGITGGGNGEKIPTHGNDISMAQHKRVFKCPHCSFWASTASRFHVHIVGHLNKKPFECSLCAYRSNWRWDITKHIKLKSVRDAAHEAAKVLMTDETGRRNYTKYNKYLTEIGNNNMDQQQQQQNVNDVLPPKLTRAPSSVNSAEGLVVKSGSGGASLRPPPPLKAADGVLYHKSRKTTSQIAKDECGTGHNHRHSSKRTFYKCKKCNFRDASRDILLAHVKSHYLPSQSSTIITTTNNTSTNSTTTSTPPSSSFTSTFSAFCSPSSNHNNKNNRGEGVRGGGSGSYSGDIDDVDDDDDDDDDVMLEDGICIDDATIEDEDDVNEDDDDDVDDDDEASVVSGHQNISSSAAKGSSLLQAPFRCGHCNQVSNWKHVIQRHCRLKHGGDIRVVSNKNGQERIECEEQTDEPDHVDVPQSTTALYKCNLCPYATDTKQEYEQHLVKHNTPNTNNTIKCQYCHYYVCERDEMVRHLALHGIGSSTQNLYNNPGNNANFEANISNNNVESSKRFKCVTCPYVTNSKSQYIYHKQFHKPRGLLWTCPHCTYNVSKRHLLNQHLKVHGISKMTQQQQQPQQNKVDNAVVVGGGLNDDDDGIEECNGELYQHFAEIPLVWVSKNGKFAKMYKCRHCPHVNLRKVNIQEHEKMHGVRVKNSRTTNTTTSNTNTSTSEQSVPKTTSSSSSQTLVEHHCTECNYVCNNAGVLSSHTKVHQGQYGTVHCLVDLVKSDEEQIRELSKLLNSTGTISTTDCGGGTNAGIEGTSTSAGIEGQAGELLYFCTDCPARFHAAVDCNAHVATTHGVRLFYKCKYCTFSARQRPHLLEHAQVHTYDYQLQTSAILVQQNKDGVAGCGSKFELQPHVVPIKDGGETVWVVDKSVGGGGTIALKNNNVPLSGTELFEHRNRVLLSTKSQMMDAAVGGGSGGRVEQKKSAVVFQCPKCPSRFERTEAYTDHLSLHGAGERYKCDVCDYSVRHYANFVQHQKNHSNVNSTSTDRNDSNVDDVIDSEMVETEVTTILQQRLTKINNSKIHKCSLCPFRAPQKDALEHHLKRHNSISNNKSGSKMCEHCDFVAENLNDLEAHEKLHFVVSGGGQSQSQSGGGGGLVRGGLDGFVLTGGCLRVMETDCEEGSGEVVIKNNKVVFEEKKSDDGIDKIDYFPVIVNDDDKKGGEKNTVLSSGGVKKYVDINTGCIEESSSKNNNNSVVAVDGDRNSSSSVKSRKTLEDS